MTAILMRKGLAGKLEPIDETGRDSLARIAHDTILSVEVKRPRNIQHFRKFWALVSLIYANQTRYRSPEELVDAIKVLAGHCFPVRLRNGTEVRIPKSIAFHAMSQDEFEKFYDRVVDIVVTEIIPGLNREDLKRELMEFAA